MSSSKLGIEWRWETRHRVQARKLAGLWSLLQASGLPALVVLAENSVLLSWAITSYLSKAPNLFAIWSRARQNRGAVQIPHSFRLPTPPKM